jgi:two-component system, NarL family, response regulator DevR
MNILIVEGHHRMRWLLAEIVRIAFEPTPVLEAGDARTALRLCREIRPELIIVAAGLGEGADVELVAEITSLLPDSKVVVLAQYRSLAGLHAAHKAGAAAFLAKDEVFEKLLPMLKRMFWRPNGDSDPANDTFTSE